MFKKLKDGLVTGILKPVINTYLSDLGRVTDLELDSASHYLYFNIQLVGENTPLSVRILQYEVKKIEEQNYLIIRKVETTRKWINIALQKWYPEPQIPIPAIAKIVL
jgi:hypothetical protein